jgi:hypothetical protein
MTQESQVKFYDRHGSEVSIHALKDYLVALDNDEVVSNEYGLKVYDKSGNLRFSMGEPLPATATA